jgi:hypothetical protein
MASRCPNQLTVVSGWLPVGPFGAITVAGGQWSVAFRIHGSCRWSVVSCQLRPFGAMAVAGGQWSVSSGTFRTHYRFAGGQWDLSEIGFNGGRAEQVESTVDLRFPVRGSDPHRAAKPVLT